MLDVLRFLVDQAAGNSGLIFDKPYVQVRTCDHDLNAQRFDVLQWYRDFPSKTIDELVVRLDDVSLYKRMGLQSSKIKSDDVGPNLLNYLSDGDCFETFDYERFHICLGKYERFDLLELYLQHEPPTACDVAGMIDMCDSPKLRELIGQYFSWSEWFYYPQNRLERLTAEQITYLLGLGVPPSKLPPCALARVRRFEDIKNPHLTDFASLGLDMVMECASRFGLDLKYNGQLLVDFIKHRQFDAIRTIAPTLAMVEKSLRATQYKFTDFVWDIESLQALTVALTKDECAQLDHYKILVDSAEAADWCLFVCHNKLVEIDDIFLTYKWRIHRKIADVTQPIKGIRNFKNAEISWLLNEGFQFNLDS